MKTPRIALITGACIATLTTSLVVIGSPAQAAGDTKTVSYDGVTASVPADWPVVDVDGVPGCVSYASHAVYLGTPSVSTCSANVLGHMETLQLAKAAAPLTTTTALARGARSTTGGTDVAPDYTVSTGGSPVQAIVTSGADPATAAMVERSVSWIGADLDAPVARASARLTLGSARATARTVGNVAGGPFHGLGFDTCAAPSLSTMTAWHASSPYDAANIYIGGADRACAQANLTASWVSSVATQGWKLIPTFVGLQAPGTGIGSMFSSRTATAASQGKAAADNAAAVMASLGMTAHAGNPVYYDMEAYNTRNKTTVAAVKAFTNAWTLELHATGYVSGIYGSSASMMTNLSGWYGDASFTKPDDIWFAHWSTPSSPVHDSYIPDSYWANHQRIHQYKGGHNETYGGATVNIDNDAMYAAAANGVPPDTTPPVAQTAALPPFTTTAIAVHWSATDSGSGVASYDVRRADTTGATHTWVQPASLSHVTSTTASMTGARGHTYCFETRARDRVGNLSKWSPLACTAVPYDDHGLTVTTARGRRWNRLTSSTFLYGTATSTSHRGAVATSRSVRLDRMGIIATRCPKCGRVGVYFNGKLYKYFNLAGPWARRVLYRVAKFKRRQAVVTVKVLTDHKAVQLDGLAIFND